MGRPLTHTKRPVRTFASLSVLLVVCACVPSPGARCGPGTVDLDGVCVVDGADGGSMEADGGSTQADGGGTDPEVDGGPERRYTSVLLSVKAPYLGPSEYLVPVGLPVTITPLVVHAGVQHVGAVGLAWSLLPAQAAPTVRAHDGVFELTASSEGVWQFTAQALTPEGFELRRTIKVRAAQPSTVTLVSASVRDGPWYQPQAAFLEVNPLSKIIEAVDGPTPAAPAVAPAGTGAARIVSAYVATLSIPQAGGGMAPSPVKFVLDPALCRYTVRSGGPAQVDARGRVTSGAPGAVVIAVSFERFTSEASLRFVDAAPVRSLQLASGALARWPNGTPPPAPREFASPEGTWNHDTVIAEPNLPQLYFQRQQPVTAWIVARHGDTEPYFEWLLWSQVRREALALPTAYRSDDSGVLTAQTPGVGVHVFSAGGVSMPVLVRVPFPTGTTIGYAVTPQAVELRRPISYSAPVSCVDLSVRLTLPGEAERPLNDYERLDATFEPDLRFVDRLDDLSTAAFHWCPRRRPGATNGTEDIWGSFLGARAAKVSLTLIGP